MAIHFSPKFLFDLMYTICIFFDNEMKKNKYTLLNLSFERPTRVFYTEAIPANWNQTIVFHSTSSYPNCYDILLKGHCMKHSASFLPNTESLVNRCRKDRFSYKLMRTPARPPFLSHCFRGSRVWLANGKGMQQLKFY